MNKDRRIGRKLLCLVVSLMMIMTLIPNVPMNLAYAEDEVSEVPGVQGSTGGTLSAEGSNFTVTVSYGEDAGIPEGAELVLTEFAEGTPAFNDAKDAVLENDGSLDAATLGMAAFDLTIYYDGAPIEPTGEVQVNFEMKSLPVNAIEETITVEHLNESTGDVVVETVAAAGDVAVQEDSVSGEFAVDSFSTFVIKWTEEEECSATIHWGSYNDSGEFEEFEQPTTIDSSAASVELDVLMDEYYFVGIDYKETADAEPVHLENATVLKKVDGAWMLGETAVADGSHIYVNYAPKGSGGYTPPEPPTPDVLAPETEKTVTENADGTYTIQLDVLGHQEEEITQVGANVIVIMDITQSMTNNMPGGGGTRMAAAKRALTALIDTLEPDTNNINFTAVNFGNSANYSNGTAWTSEESDMRAYISGLPNNPGDLGTCWQAGLQGGIDRVGTAPAGNETYVIFVTDGNPNGWVNAQGRYQQQGAGGFVQAAYNAAVPNANTLAGISHLYGVFVGDADGYDHLEDLINNAGGDGVINGSTTAAIEQAFSDIAQTIIDNLGAGNTVVDDGIPTLSNVSANVSAGEAGAFEYYITPKNGTQTKWDEAPGASYDKTNGVTWDLSEAGVLQDGYTYTLKFTVWPSQAAYDLIADLNNGKVDFDDLTEEQKNSIVGSKETGYTLKTNTHLFTTFTDLDGKEYREENDARPAAMDLPTTTISVVKYWNNEIDARTADKVTLTVTRDGEPYLDVDMGDPVQTGAHTWKQEPTDEIYISYGQIAGGVVKETGHEYTVIEPENFSYRWDLTADVYRPMIIDGVKKVLIKSDEKPEGTEGEDYYVIDDKYYEVSDQDDHNVLVAYNDRRSNLAINKVVTGTGAPADAVFAIEFTVDDVNGNHPGDEAYDEWYDTLWFAVQTDPADRSTVVKEGVTVEGATAEDGNTGFYWFDNGGTVTVYLKAGQYICLTNLPKDAEYTVKELLGTDMPDGFQFVKAESDADNKAGGESTPAEIDENTAEGTIDQSNTDYSVTYTNKYEKKDITFTKSWADENDLDKIRPDANAFKNYITLMNGTASLADKGFAPEITDNKDNTYTIKYTGVPVYINNEEVDYKLSESEITGYTTTGSPAAVGGTITNTHVPETMDVSATKTWDDADNTDGKRADVTLILLANGEPVADSSKTIAKDATGDALTVTWEKVPVAAAGDPITYTVKEDGEENGKITMNGAEYTVTYGGDAEEGLTVKNSYTPAETTLTVTKVWDDKDDKDGLRTDSVSVQLMADGKASGEPVELSEENGWKYEWTELAAYASGNPIAYTVTEEEVPEGYEAKIGDVTGDAENGYKVEITNYHKASYDKVMSDPPVQKVVNGNPSKQETFTFQMKALTDGAPMPEGSKDGVKSVDITGSGSYEFGEMYYEKPGQWKYEITEVKGSAEGYTYDSTVYTLIVSVKEVADGTQYKLEKTEEIVGGNGKIVFTNEYKEPAVKTGDTTIVTPYIVIGISALILLLMLLLRGKKNKA